MVPAEKPANLLDNVGGYTITKLAWRPHPKKTAACVLYGTASQFRVPAKRDEALTNDMVNVENLP
jgi:hypothetical protein